MENTEYENLSQSEKKKLLFIRQRDMLLMFAEKGAISKAQYEKSYCDLVKKMGIDTDEIR